MQEVWQSFPWLKLDNIKRDRYRGFSQKSPVKNEKHSDIITWESKVVLRLDAFLTHAKKKGFELNKQIWNVK